ncbi:unnamed protein product [Ilex paraguariensis]|uniref:Uncharacterized protein n=1 Tax=Ilex paraguariensis TaxID=185542 RepID=A0ABC8SP19_9AQUA
MFLAQIKSRIKLLVNAFSIRWKVKRFGQCKLLLDGLHYNYKSSKYLSLKHQMGSHLTPSKSTRQFLTLQQIILCRDPCSHFTKHALFLTRGKARCNVSEKIC